MRVQKAENVNMALEFIRSRGVKLTNIGPEGTFYSYHDFIRLILFLDIMLAVSSSSLVWYEHLFYASPSRTSGSSSSLLTSLGSLNTFAESEEGLFAKEGLLLGVNVKQNLTKKSTCRIFHIVGLTDLPCSCTFLYSYLGVQDVLWYIAIVPIY